MLSNLSLSQSKPNVTPGSFRLEQMAWHSHSFAIVRVREFAVLLAKLLRRETCHELLITVKRTHPWGWGWGVRVNARCCFGESAAASEPGSTQAPARTLTGAATHPGALSPVQVWSMSLQPHGETHRQAASQCAGPPPGHRNVTSRRVMATAAGNTW